MEFFLDQGRALFPPILWICTDSSNSKPRTVKIPRVRFHMVSFIPQRLSSLTSLILLMRNSFDYKLLFIQFLCMLLRTNKPLSIALFKLVLSFFVFFFSDFSFPFLSELLRKCCFQCHHFVNCNCIPVQQTIFYQPYCFVVFRSSPSAKTNIQPNNIQKQ